MKKPIFVVFMALGLSFFSCNKDDENKGDTPEAQLAGTWRLVSGISAGEPDELDDCDKKTIAIFKSDNTFAEEYHYTHNESCIMAPTSGTWEIISEGKIKAIYNNIDEGQTETEVVDYELSGNTLKMIYGIEGGEDSNTYQRQ